MTIENQIHTALYRTWRPLIFKDIVGQEHIVRTLTCALKTNRVAHAYLFSGPRGTGKTTMARILAKAVNCSELVGIEPCNQCHNCMSITNGSMVDVLELDAASNRGVDEIRQLRDRVRYISTEAERKVYIIDEAHMLTTEAFNALLKVLEEPPQGIIFVLATTEIHKIPATIVSRCQTFSFGPIACEMIVARLQQITKALQMDATIEALIAIARAAEGGLRDAIGILEQATLVCGDTLSVESVMLVLGSISRDVTQQLLDMIIDIKLIDISNLLQDHLKKGVDPMMILQELIFICRDKLITKLISANGVPDTESSKIVNILHRLVEYQPRLRHSVHPRIMLETMLLTLAIDKDEYKQSQSHCQCGALIERLTLLENKVNAINNEVVSTPMPSPSPISVKSTMNYNILPLQQLVATATEELLQEVRQFWPQILTAIKKEKITVHAWLVAGEVEAATREHILIVYKSKIHRDTIMKEANKMVVDKVVTNILQRQCEIHSVMYEEWQQIKKNSEGSVEARETNESENDIVKKAIELFGAELVEVK